MTSKVTLDIEGANTANRVLQGLEYRLRRNIVQAAVRAGMGVVRQTARQLAPSDTGLLRRQLAVSVKTDRVTGVVSGTLKPKRTKAARRKGFRHSAHYHHLVIRGTDPHVIPGGVIGGNYYSRIEHPGIPPRPWMDLAVSQAYRPALVAFSLKLDERLSKEASKAHARQRPK